MKNDTAKYCYACKLVFSTKYGRPPKSTGFNKGCSAGDESCHYALCNVCIPVHKNHFTFVRKVDGLRCCESCEELSVQK